VRSSTATTRRNKCRSVVGGVTVTRAGCGRTVHPVRHGPAHDLAIANRRTNSGTDDRSDDSGFAHNADAVADTTADIADGRTIRSDADTNDDRLSATVADLDRYTERKYSTRRKRLRSGSGGPNDRLRRASTPAGSERGRHRE
jgi:hypothetical protein